VPLTAGNALERVKARPVAFVFVGTSPLLEAALGECSELNVVDDQVAYFKAPADLLPRLAPKLNVRLPAILLFNDNASAPVQAYGGPEIVGDAIAWLEGHKRPLLTAISMNNWFSVTGDAEHLAVVAALKEKEHPDYLAMFRRVAAQESRYRFGFVDVHEFPNFVDRRFGLSAVPSFVVLNGTGNYYYSDGKTGHDDAAVRAFLQLIEGGSVRAKGAGSGFLGMAEELAWRVIYVIRDNPWLGVAMIAVAVIPVLLFRFCTMEDEEDGEPTNGHSGNGKEKEKEKAGKLD